MGTKKMISKKASRQIEMKNYLIAAAVFIGIILIVLYAFEWYQVKQEEKLMKSYLVNTNTINFVINDPNSANQVLQEAPKDYFIFVGYRNDEDEYLLEKSVKKIIDDYEINDIVYYFDATDIKQDSNYLEKINESLKVNISQVPAIIYIKDGKVAEEGIVDGKDEKLLTANDFEKLLNIYEYTKKEK